MHHSFVPIRIHGVGAKFTMQHISVRMQDKAKKLPQSGKLDLLNHIKGICAVLGAPLDHFVQNIILVENFVVAQSPLQSN